MDNMCNYNIEIRQASLSEWDEVITLAWKTFLKFEAKDYGNTGIRSFREFLTDSMLRKMFILGQYPMLVAICEGQIIGMAALREKRHISLLFVEEGHHKLGIGSRLIFAMEKYILEDGGSSMTVNAAPYAVDFYHKLGFEDVAPELMRDGIRYTPMERNF